MDPGEDQRGTDGAASGADPLGVERMADGDVALYGEGKHEQRAQVLRGEKDDRKRLAKAGPLQHRNVPLCLQLEKYLPHSSRCVAQIRVHNNLPTRH